MVRCSWPLGMGLTSTRWTTAQMSQSTPLFLQQHLTATQCGCILPGNVWSCSRHRYLPVLELALFGRQGISFASAPTTHSSYRCCGWTLQLGTASAPTTFLTLFRTPSTMPPTLPLHDPELGLSAYVTRSNPLCCPELRQAAQVIPLFAVRLILKCLAKGTLFISDVGWNSWEEIDVTKPTGGDNFGWPCIEGEKLNTAVNVLTTYLPPNPTINNCATFAKTVQHTLPLIVYPHARHVPGLQVIGRCSIGTAFYTHGEYTVQPTHHNDVTVAGTVCGRGSSTHDVLCGLHNAVDQVR